MNGGSCLRVGSSCVVLRAFRLPGRCKHCHCGHPIRRIRETLRSRRWVYRCCADANTHGAKLTQEAEASHGRKARVGRVVGSEKGTSLILGAVRGEVALCPAQTFTKTVYDGLGRATTSYVAYDLAETTYPIPSGSIGVTVTGDTVFAQSETTYDPAGNVIFTAARSRLATSGTATGDLSASGGTLARSSYAETWFDGVGRPTVSADYGISGGTAIIQAPPPATFLSVPTASSGTCLVTSTTYSYNATGAYATTGLLVQTTDPMRAVNQVQYNAAGRTIQTVQNFLSSGGTGSDSNIIVQTAYTPDGMLATLTASNSATGNQVTKYAYGTSMGTADSGVARTDLLKAVIYPSSTDTFTISGGTPSFSGIDNLVQYTYNQLGERVSMTDENQTAHAYVLDGLGGRRRIRSRSPAARVWTATFWRSLAVTSLAACSRRLRA